MSKEKWIKLSEYSSAVGLPRERIYNLIKKGKLSKRVEDGEAEVLLAGDDLDAYKKAVDDGEAKEDETMRELVETAQETSPSSEDAALKLMQRALRAFVLIHKEVSNEKRARIEDLNKVIESKDMIIDDLKETGDDYSLNLKELTRENETMKEALTLRDAVLKEKEKLIRETKRLAEHKDEILAERGRALEELTKSLDEMGVLIEEKTAVIDQMKNGQPIITDSFGGGPAPGELAELNRKLQKREQELEDARSLIRTLESKFKYDSSVKSALKETSEESTQVAFEMMEDQLEYIMRASEISEPSSEDQ